MRLFVAKIRVSQFVCALDWNGFGMGVVTEGQIVEKSVPGSS